MKTIYFVRHGEAEINPTAEIQPTHVKAGLAELTPRGFVQAEQIAERVEKLPIQALIASTMVRAEQTASIIGKRIHIPVELSDLFIERREPSHLIGLEWNAPETQKLFKEWQQTFFTNTRMGDGENFNDIIARTKQALTFLSTRPEEQILVVTHGYFMRGLMARMLLEDDMTPLLVHALHHRLRLANTGITIVQYDESKESPWRIVVWNDHAHLGE